PLSRAAAALWPVRPVPSPPLQISPRRRKPNFDSILICCVPLVSKRFRVHGGYGIHIMNRDDDVSDRPPPDPAETRKAIVVTAARSKLQVAASPPPEKKQPPPTEKKKAPPPSSTKATVPGDPKRLPQPRPAAAKMR
ncbi:unnamed protein product, partial [Urochloa humidicola]